jgi:lipopolysaccharide biosynthesis protein
MKHLNLNLLKAVILFFIFFILLYRIFFTNEILVIDMNIQLSQYEKNLDFSNFKSDIKTIAIYLPQFHTIKENDIWWGKGFTEWTNVKKSKPHFEGHHQPRIPGDKLNYLEYYELTNSNIIKKQIQLAKNHGIYGFGIYYYWFSGKRLLEKPLDIYLNDKSLNFPFLLIWANENWTRHWNGRNKDILIKQEYKHKDPELFIKDIKKYLIDRRYIKIDNRPVIGLYEPFDIPQLKKTIKIWREKSLEYGIGGIFILVCLINIK